MNFVLKIVEGPNRGAEIALVEGVAVTLGKGDECDIVLADSTLPEEPLSIEATGDAVTVNGEQLEQFAVKTLGATSIAVGPADAPWGELKWPEKGEVSRGDAETQSKEAQSGEDESSRRDAEPQSAEAEGEEKPSDSAPPREEKKRHGCLGCLVVVVLLVLLLGALAWLFRATVRPYAEKVLAYARETLHFGGRVLSIAGTSSSPFALKRILESLNNDLPKLRDVDAAGVVYGKVPGNAADDALFTITEGAMKVVTATNRVLSIAGTSSSPFALKRILESLSVDLPKLRDVDATGVAYGIVPGNEEIDNDDGEMPIGVSRAKRRASKPNEPSLPVCGILTTPYPCLVMRDGSRVLEGAALGGNVIVKIEADAVTVTNATGRFTWKP